MAVSIPQKAPVPLLLRGELIARTKISKAKLTDYLNDGMPHYRIGNEYRFLESEVLNWLETYQPSQERLEKEFRDKKGRTIEEYVTHEVILTTLRITKDNLVGLSKKGLPFASVGEKKFYHLGDILDLYRQGTVINSKGRPTGNAKKSFLESLSMNVPKKVPFIIIDGSYNFKKSSVGTGLVLVENRDTATCFSNVLGMKTTKPIICEFLALLEALRLIKSKKINKAIIVTDQKAWTKGITIDVNYYEGPAKQYMKELKHLLSELNSQIEVKFVGEMNDSKNNVLYKKAHSLSREHKKVLNEKMDF